MPLRQVKRRAKDVATAFLVIVAAALAAVALQSLNARTMAGQARVIDGDTLSIGDMRVRLRGIDAPELDQTCDDAGGIAQPCGRLSASHLADIVSDRMVSCVAADIDRYDRPLGVCHHDDESAGLSFNEVMVRDGWAIAYGGYRAAESLARAEGRGLWALQFERPQDWRRRTAEVDDRTEPRTGLGSLMRRARAVIGWGGHNE